MSIEIVDLIGAETLDLRREVLRNGDPEANVVWDEDTWPGTIHLGARLDGVLVGTSTWIPRPFPAGPDDHEDDDRDDHDDEGGWQLRGMATANGQRGTGVGGQLLDAGCDRCAASGGRLAWARARDAALVFYGRHGFEVVGDGFIDATTALPHHLVRRAPVLRQALPSSAANDRQCR